MQSAIPEALILNLKKDYPRLVPACKVVLDKQSLSRNQEAAEL